MRRVYFEPEGMAQATRAILREEGVEIRYRTSYADVACRGGCGRDQSWDAPG